MKKLIVIILTMVFAFSLTTVAFAVPGIAPDGIEQGGYDDPTAGVNPHSGYSVTSNKCKTCHAVHGATAGGETLLRSSRANACVYCHVSNTFSIKHPYGTDATKYTVDYENNHAATHFNSAPDPAYAGCVSCHSVHGANTWSGSDGVTAGMILRNNPGGTITAGGVGAVAAAVTNLDDYCRDCHDGTGAVGTYCVNCHNDPQMKVTKLATRNGVSHVMTTTMTGNYDTQVAWTTSQTCRMCHKGAATYADENSFPHLTSGADFLSDNHTSTSPLDRVCLECHQNGPSGVGLTF